MATKRNQCLALKIARTAFVCGLIMVPMNMPAAIPDSSVDNLSVTANDQDGRVITVKVKDSSGPVAGASIMVNGTRDGAFTDMNGEATLNNVRPDASITVSFIGYETQIIQVDGRASIEVTLKVDSETLEELVVVGYGVQKKVNLSGSVATADTKKLESRPASNIANALQGAVANLNIDPAKGTPGSSTSMNVRGFTSINGGSPLVVIDGIISEVSELNRMNPNDIETISVLKDAASAAIYGSRAAFGVILVNTKTGKSEKVTVNYNNYFDYADINTVRRKLCTDPYQAMLDVNTVTPEYNFFNDECLAGAKAYRDGLSDKSYYYSDRWGYNWYYDSNDRWDSYFKTAFGMNHSIDLSGKTDRVNYFASADYKLQNGILTYGKDIYKQYNTRVKLETKVNNWLTIGSSTSLSNGTYDTSSYNLQNDTQTNGSVLYNIFGWTFMPNKLPNGRYEDIGGTTTAYLEAGGDGRQSNSSINQQLTAQIDLIKDVLFIKGNYNYQRRDEKTNYALLPVDIYDTEEAYDWTINDPSSATINSAIMTHNTYDIFANFTKTFGGKHFFNVIAGFNQEDYRYNLHTLNKTELITTSLPSIGLASGTSTVNESTTTWAVRGAFARFNYIYDNKYIAEFNFRRDGTSRFPKDSRWANNPSASLAWVISEENFFKGLRDKVDLFKIRASYGTLGNQDVSAYAYIATMNAQKNSVVLDGKQNMFVTTPGLVSGNLTWEKVATSNIGVDLNMFGNRLQFSADYYIRDTRDMLTAALPLPSVLGTSAPMENSADLRTKGWEITLSWRDGFNLAGKPFNYSVDLNMSDARAKITKMASNSEGVLSKFGWNNYYYEGMEVGDMWGLETVGLFQSDEEAKNWADQSKVQSYGTQAGDLKFADLDGDGKITTGASTLKDHGDMRLIGNTQVRYRFGTTLSAEWNGFDLKLFFQGVLKHQFCPYWNNYTFWGLFTNGWGAETYGNAYDSWTPENKDAYFPRLKHYQNWNIVSDWEICQTRFMQNGAYVRLKNVTFGYSLPQRLTRKINIERVRFFYSGDNLFTLSGLYKYSNLDPEDATGCAYPLQRHNSFGINVTF